MQRAMTARRASTKQAPAIVPEAAAVTPTFVSAFAPPPEVNVAK
jgi:hypothetical protein